MSATSQLVAPRIRLCAAPLHSGTEAPGVLLREVWVGIFQRAATPLPACCMAEAVEGASRPRAVRQQCYQQCLSLSLLIGWVRTAWLFFLDLVLPLPACEFGPGGIIVGGQRLGRGGATTMDGPPGSTLWLDLVSEV